MELFYVLTILDRARADMLIDIYKELNLSLIMANLGNGTATSEHLSLYDLEPSDKTIVETIATSETLKQLIKLAKRKLFIDIPGNGIMMAIPLKSVCGGKNLAYITEGQTVGGAIDNMMNCENELIVVILNEGFSDDVMDAARSAGASGGTVIHAKGTGKRKAEKFYGVSLAEERDMIYILESTTKKSNIMKAINEKCGAGTEIEAICFSIPVSETAGMRKFEED
ncbi:MAG: P-II family nitrogen regulator [Eubacteriales bacterium]|nr:P-II family nitrogen regulator [Eubacteriales bacterium]